MTIQIHWVLPLCLTVTALSGCGAGGERSLVGGGSNTAELAIQAWQSSLASKDITLTYRSNGERVGAQEFYQGTADVVISARDSLASSNGRIEVEKKQSYVRIPILVADIAIAYIEPGCRLSLTKQSLTAVFTGHINSYAQLGCGDSPLTVLTREQDSGTRQSLYKYLGISDGSRQRSDRWIKSEPVVTRNMANVISSVSGGFGYIPGPLLRFHNVSIVKVDSGHGKSYLPRISPHAAESQEEFSRDIGSRSVEGSQDYPIKNVTYLYIKKNGNGRKLTALRELARFAISDKAQEVAMSKGYIRLSQEQVRQGLVAIKEITD